MDAINNIKTTITHNIKPIVIELIIKSNTLTTSHKDKAVMLITNSIKINETQCKYII